MSSIAQNKLKTLEADGRQCTLNQLYSQYDVNRNGKIPYKDFTATLVAASAGLRKDEAAKLAKSLDINKTGTIEYRYDNRI